MTERRRCCSECGGFYDEIFFEFDPARCNGCMAAEEMKRKPAGPFKVGGPVWQMRVCEAMRTAGNEEEVNDGETIQ